MIIKEIYKHVVSLKNHHCETPSGGDGSWTTKFPKALKNCIKLKMHEDLRSYPRDHMGAVILDVHCTSIKK